MALSLRYAARSDVGLVRDGNEDALYAGPGLLAVADGMGGHAAGEVASRVVIETVATLDGAPAGSDSDGDHLTGALRRAVETANGYLRDMVAADSALEGMGTTLTALAWVGQQLGLVHIGDSRAYLLRDGALEQVTHDHTLVQSLIDQGRITPDEATTHPQRSWITNALDGRADIELDLSVRDARAGDRYLICSDGLSSYVSEQTLEEELRSGDPQSACDRLVDLALRAGGPDNVTVIVADLVTDDTSEGAPIVGGAAAEPSATQRSTSDSPAARAAAIQSAGPSPAGDDDADDGPDDAGARRGAHRLLYVVLAGVVILVLAAIVGTVLYVRDQYFVAATSGSPPTVAVYRGVQGHVVGIDMSRLADPTDLPVSAVPPYERDRVTSGITAKNHSDAQRIVATLRHDACAAASPTPTPTPSPSPSRHRRSGKAARPSPSPSPPPPPPYCNGPS